ncbi:hypothetical protein [Sutcliffiella sp. BMC8]|uniref:hypothetical protein n=1 Tax=Sutcliffiella sp. BMC8 TaxID=3073243 RepID=UPI0030D579C1
MKRISRGLVSICLLVLVACTNQNTEEYKSNLQSVAEEMLNNTTKAETILSEYSNVWKFSIDSGTAIGVNDMATKTGLDEEIIREHFEINSIGNVSGDFSSNVNSLKSYYKAIGKLDEIEATSKEIKSKINELNNPPEEYEKVYDEVLEMFTYSEEYIEMALNPTGSLQSFNDDKHRLTKEISSKFNRMEVLMPNDD